MKKIIVLFIIIFLMGCFTKEYFEELPPLRWQDGKYFYSEVELPGRHPYLSIGVRCDKKEDWQNKLKEIHVKCEIKNEGDNALKISWIADSFEEKKSGDRVVTFDDGSEKRTAVLKTGQGLIWYIGKMDGLMNTDFLTIQDYEKHSKRWEISLRLDFDNPEKLININGIERIEIPISAYSSDNI